MKFKTVFTSMAAAGVVLASGVANAGLASFWFDPDGAAGPSGAIFINEFFDITGAVYAQNTYTGATTFTLEQSGYALVTGADGNIYDPIDPSSNPFSGKGVIATFSGGGTGDLATASTSFDSGTINVFAGGLGGSTIASFEIVGGSARINSASAQPNGDSTLVGQATLFSAGYFFFNDGGSIGADFSTLDLTADTLFGFATTNLSLATASGTISAMKGVLDAAGLESGPGANVFDEFGRLTDLYSGGNGQFRLTESEVPEPGSLVLAGLGLLGLGMFRRKARG